MRTGGTTLKPSKSLIWRVFVFLTFLSEPFSEPQLLVEFFEGRDFVVESNLGDYIRKELSDDDYYGSQLVHLKKNSLNLIINYENLENNEMLFQLVLFDDDDKKEFKYIIGVPEIVDDGF